MTPPDYSGDNDRRKDSVSVRLALLESHHEENKASLVSVHKRISAIQSGVEQEIRSGLSAIFAKIDVQQAGCKAHSDRTLKLETSYDWIFRWLLGTWTALAAGVGLVFQHHDKIKAIK